MENQNDYPNQLKDLRKKATRRLAGSVEIETPSVSDPTARALQELKIHQIELELQNEELRRAQSELERSRDRYLRLYHQSPVGYVVTDKAGMILYANETFGNMLDLAISDLLRKPLSQWIHPKDRDHFFARFRSFYNEPLGKQIDIRFQFGRGNLMNARLTASKSDVPGGLIPSEALSSQLLIAITDTTEQKKAERKIVGAKRQWEQTFDAVPDLIALVSSSLVVQRVNVAFARRLGRTPQKCIGKKCHDLIFGNPCRPGECLHDRIVQVGGTASSEIYIERFDGHYTVSATSIMADENEAPWMILVFHDISARKIAEKELLRYRNLESIGALAGGIAHDFNNMLTSLVGHVELAMFKYNGSTEVSDHLTQALEASGRIRDLANRLLTFSGGGTPRRQAIDIASLIMEITRFTLSGANIRPEFDIQKELPPLAIDEPQIRNAFQSIITNAKEAMLNGGVLSISATSKTIRPANGGSIKPGEYVEIEFRDQGSGIDSDQLEKVFDPYFTTKMMGAEKGMGLGLAIAYSVIKKHNGYLNIQSAEGIGTVVKVHLPISAVGETIASSCPVGQGVTATGSPAFLVMEDEIVLWDMMDQLFKRIDCKVDFAANGAEAMELFKASINKGRPYAGVFLDLTIRGSRGGKEVVQKILEIDADTRAIAFSGYTSDPVFDNPSEFGFSGVLRKPFKIDEFQSVISWLINGVSRP